MRTIALTEQTDDLLKELSVKRKETGDYVKSKIGIVAELIKEAYIKEVSK